MQHSGEKRQMKIEYNIYCLMVLFLVNLAETCAGQISHKKGKQNNLHKENEANFRTIPIFAHYTCAFV